jgi:hypothetical protein
VSYLLNFTIIILLLLSVCSESDRDNSKEIIKDKAPITIKRYVDVYEEIESIRQQVYRSTDLVGSNEFVIDHNDYSVDELQKMFDKNQGGVHCGGIATVLASAYRDNGYVSYVYSYGFKNALTHAVTLVEINGELYLHDAYLNYSFRKPLVDILDDLIVGIVPQYYLGKPEQRDVHYISYENMHKSWNYDGDERNKDCVYNGGKYTCRSIQSPSLLFSRYHMNETYNILHSMGHPSDYAYALLYPYGIFSFRDGYTENFGSTKNNGWLGKIAEHIYNQSSGKVNLLDVSPRNILDNI